jgi:hypothetical protein
MKNRKLIGAFLAGIMAISLVGCGGASSNYSTTNLASADNSWKSADMATTSLAETADETNDAAASTAVTPEGSRKIVYTSSLNVECADAASTASKVKGDVAASGGYVESSSKDTGTSYLYYYITARIPSNKYSDFMAAADKYGNVTSQNENTEDITLNYVDVEAHIKALEDQRDRLNTLMDNAQDLDSVLKIQAQLTDILYQLDSYESQIKAMDNQVDYCTVSFTLSQPTIVSPASELFGDRVAAAWSNGIHVFVDFVEGTVLAVVTLLPFIGIVAAASFAIVAWKKKHTKTKKASLTYVKPDADKNTKNN